MTPKPELTEIAELVAADLKLKGVSFCGKGAFKETFRVQDPEGKSIALKLVDRDKIDSERTEREISALKRCNSNRIAKVLDTKIFEAKDKRVFDIVLEEFFDGGSLEDRLKENGDLTKKEIVDLAIGLFLAVGDLCPLQLVHRDIKPANIMFRKGSSDPVLVDFGLVRDLSKSSLTASWVQQGPGTPFYSSPEQLNNDKVLIDWRSDEFSIGIVLATLLFKEHPYQTDSLKSNSAVYAVLERKGPTEKFVQAVNEMGLSAIAKMVKPWPVQRFGKPEKAIAALNK